VAPSWHPVMDHLLSIQHPLLTLPTPTLAHSLWRGQSRGYPKNQPRRPLGLGTAPPARQCPRRPPAHFSDPHSGLAAPRCLRDESILFKIPEKSQKYACITLCSFDFSPKIGPNLDYGLTAAQRNRNCKISRACTVAQGVCNGVEKRRRLQRLKNGRRFCNAFPCVPDTSRNARQKRLARLVKTP
jgi:hypothetical protein